MANVSQGFRIKVFRSQGSRGKKVVRPPAERLRKDRMKVWLDEWMRKPGGSMPATHQLPTLMTEGYFIP
jgi:hypothetical protein